MCYGIQLPGIPSPGPSQPMILAVLKRGPAAVQAIASEMGIQERAVLWNLLDMRCSGKVQQKCAGIWEIVGDGEAGDDEEDT